MADTQEEIVVQEAMELPIEETVVHMQDSSQDINTADLTASAIEAGNGMDDPHKHVDELLTNQAVVETMNDTEDDSQPEVLKADVQEIPSLPVDVKEMDSAEEIEDPKPEVSSRQSRGGGSGTCFICMSKGVTSNCPHGKKLPDDIKPLEISLPEHRALDGDRYSDGSATPPATFGKFPAMATDECHVCGDSFSSLKQLRQHLATHGKHQASLSHWCNSCRRRFDKADALTKHQKDHANYNENDTFICSCCEMHFFKQFHRDKHEQSTEHKLRAEAAKSGFTLRQLLARDNPDLLSTNTALQSAPRGRKSSAKTPTARGKTDELRCDVCDMSFSAQHWLDKHNKSTKHQTRMEEEKRKNKDSAFSCEACGYNFSSRSWYQMHLRSEKHKKQMKNYKKGDKSKDEEPKKRGRKAAHKCEDCNKTFTSAADLDAHTIQTHTQKGKKRGRKSDAAVPAKKARTGAGNKKFKCTECTQSYTTQKALQNHEKKVHGETSFFCQICQGTFHNEKSLEKHLRMHRGESSGEEAESESDDSSDSDDSDTSSDDSDSSSGDSSDSSDSSDDSSDEEEDIAPRGQRPPPGSAAARFFCEVCSRNCATAVNYSRHLEGAPHARMLKKRAAALAQGKSGQVSPEESEEEIQSDTNDANRPMELNDVIYQNPGEPYSSSIVGSSMSQYPSITHGTNTVGGHREPASLLTTDMDIGGYSAVDAQGNEFYVPSKAARSTKKRWKPKVNPNGPVFACYVCNSFTSDCRSAIEEHVAVKHPNIGGVYPCHTCHLRFDLESQLNQHQAIHIGDNMFHCPICRIEFSDFKVMHEHMLEEGHESNETLFLTDKGRQKPPVEQYAGRYAIEEDGTYTCLECNHTFSQKKYWIQHVNSRQHKDTMTGTEGTKVDPEAFAGRYRVGADGVFTCIECDLECSHRKYWLLHVGGKKHIQILAGVQIVNPKRPPKKPKPQPSYESYLLPDTDPTDSFAVEVGQADDHRAATGGLTVDKDGNIIDTTHYGKPLIRQQKKPSHYYCTHCDRTFTTVANYKRHLEQHEAAQYQLAGQAPIVAADLLDEEKKKKKKKRKGPFECKICSVKAFKTFKGLRNHCLNNKEHERQKQMLSRYGGTVYDGLEQYIQQHADEDFSSSGESGSSSSESDSDEMTSDDEQPAGVHNPYDLIKHEDSDDDDGTFMPAAGQSFIHTGAASTPQSLFIPAGAAVQPRTATVFQPAPQHNDADEFVAQEVEIG